MNSMQFQSVQGNLIRHGLLVMLIGLVAGFGYVYALIGELRISPIPIVFMDTFPGEPAQWRTIHLGCLLNGMLAIILAWAISIFEASEGQIKIFRYGVLLAIWGNTIFYTLTMFSPNRGLTIGDNALGEGNLPGDIAYLVAFVGAVGLIVAVVTLLRAPLKNKGDI